MFSFNKQPATSGTGAFGANPTNPSAQAQASGGGGLFGSAPAQSNASTNAFGSTFGSNPNAPPTGGLFGAGANASNNAAPVGGLFGAPTSNTGANSGSGGLFGNRGGVKSAGNGLFAAPNAASSGGGGGLFGNPGNTGANQAPGSGGVFGQQPAANITSGSGSVFGASTGGNSAAAAAPVITPFTRPSDLAENLQRELENTDLYIRQQAQLCEDIHHALPEHRTLVTSVPRDVQLLRFKLAYAKETIKYDDNRLATLKPLVDRDYADAELLTQVTKQPRRYDRLLPYFRRSIDCKDRLEQLALAMRDVQQVVSAEEFGKRVTYDEHGVSLLPRALEEEYRYFMSLSDQVADLHRRIEDKGEVETFEEMQA